MSIKKTCTKAANLINLFFSNIIVSAATVNYSRQKARIKELISPNKTSEDLLLRDIISQYDRIVRNDSKAGHLTSDHLIVAEHLLKSNKADLFYLGSFGRFKLLDSTLVVPGTINVPPVILYKLGGTDGVAYLFWGGLYALPLVLVDTARKCIFIFHDSYSVQPKALQLSSLNLLLIFFRKHLASKMKFMRSFISTAPAPKPDSLKTILFFGVTGNFGHYLWNEVSGIYDLIESGLINTIDLILVGQFDYCNFAEIIEKRFGKTVRPFQLCKENNVSDNALDIAQKAASHLLIRFNDIVLTNSYCNFFGTIPQTKVAG